MAIDQNEYKRVLFAIRFLAQIAKKHGWQMNSMDIKQIIGNPNFITYIGKYIVEAEKEMQSKNG
ncbi:MAG: hypothetical protein [Podoviridae sp. ctg2L5]|nr:MAG: hypothetical protein [Podoviridae sp. ctg2L5]